MNFTGVELPLDLSRQREYLNGSYLLLQLYSNDLLRDVFNHSISNRRVILTNTRGSRGRRLHMDT